MHLPNVCSICTLSDGYDVLFAEDILKHKGPAVFNEEDRYKMVRSIKWVDEVSTQSNYRLKLMICQRYCCDGLSYLIPDTCSHKQLPKQQSTWSSVSSETADNDENANNMFVN